MRNLNNRVLVFVSKKDNLFLSCKVLISNFLSTLTHTNYLFETISVEESDRFIENKITSFRPSLIIAIDNSIVLKDFMKTVIFALSLEIKFFVFIYGLFYRRSNELVDALKNENTKNLFLVCFSHAQKKQLDLILSCNSLIYHPPVDNKTFVFDEDLRSIMRSNYNLEVDDQVFIYSGRISHQKNIALLIKCFLSLQSLDPKFKLFIIGQLDNSFNFDPFVEDLKESENVYVIAHNISQSMLSHYYSMADYFISLSKHHDEIYGLSAREAYANGLGLFLSDWGGHKDLFENQNIATMNFNEKEIVTKLHSLVSDESIRRSFLKEPKVSRTDQVSNLNKMLSFEAVNCLDKIEYKVKFLDNDNLAEDEYRFLYSSF